MQREALGSSVRRYRFSSLFTRPARSSAIRVDTEVVPGELVAGLAVGLSAVDCGGGYPREDVLAFPL
jgi:hypothetical protein